MDLSENVYASPEQFNSPAGRFRVIDALVGAFKALQNKDFLALGAQSMDAASNIFTGLDNIRKATLDAITQVANPDNRFEKAPELPEEPGSGV